MRNVLYVATTLFVLPGCYLAPGLIGLNAANASWPVERGTGANPLISGSPLRVGFEQDTTCGTPFVGDGTTVSLEGDQVCLGRRILISTPATQTVPPMLPGATLEIVTEKARSDNLSLTATPTTFASQCTVGVNKESIWGGEYRVCVPNTVLMEDTQKVTVRQIINGAWVDIVEWTITAAGAPAPGDGGE